MLKVGICVCLLGAFAGANFPSEPETSNPFSIIYNGKTPLCIGGTIEVSEKRIVIVTAAHCVRAQSKLTVLLGTEKISIDQVIVHPFYSPPSSDYDIAILKISKPPKNSDASSPLVLYKNKSVPIDLKVTIMQTAPEPSVSLELSAEPVERHTCQTNHGNKIRVSTKMLCAQVKSSVLGGSALTFKNDSTLYLVGVASYGLDTTLPKIFTNIANSEIYSFIEKYA